MAGYNYVEFVMETLGDSKDVVDGRMEFCAVRDLEGELLVHKRRMVMVKDSEVEKKTRDVPSGTRVHVLGLPRINLALVDWRVKAASNGRAEVLEWTLPYEIMVVGFYKIVPTRTLSRTEHWLLVPLPTLQVVSSRERLARTSSGAPMPAGAALKQRMNKLVKAEVLTAHTFPS